MHRQEVCRLFGHTTKRKKADVGMLTHRHFSILIPAGRNFGFASISVLAQRHGDESGVIHSFVFGG